MTKERLIIGTQEKEFMILASPKKITELKEQEKLEYKEMKNQKRLELIRKLNPFRKK